MAHPAFCPSLPAQRSSAQARNARAWSRLAERRLPATVAARTADPARVAPILGRDAVVLPLTRPVLPLSALVERAAGVREEATLTVDVRGRLQAMEVVRPPFVPSHVR